MATIIFVHGTNVRLKQEYLQTLNKIKEKINERDEIKHFKVKPCFWGGDAKLGLGAKLNANGASIPSSKQDLEPEINPGNQDFLRWKLLSEDPLYEVRLLAIKESGMDESSYFTGNQSGDKFKRNLIFRIENRTISDELQSKLNEAGIADVFDTAWQEVAKSRPLKEALKDPSEPLSDYPNAIARAIVAKAIEYCEKQQKDTAILTNKAVRDEVVQLLKSELGDTDLGIGSWLMSTALWVGTPLIENQRLSYTRNLLPMLGDIILYQSRGQKIRELIFSLVEESEPPVVLLAHSLGGIACVDLLIKGLDSATPDEDLLVREQLNKVSLLVTAGSQSPFLYEIGALHSRQYGEPLPDYFPEWLNFYHKWDFLSYIGADVFPKPNRITDIEIDDRKRFLESHSSYWENSKTWNEITLKLL